MALDLTKGKSANMIKDIASKSREESGKKTIKNIDMKLIDMNEDNDKIFECDNLDSLVDAIKRNGFQGTIEVYLKKDGRYGLLSGHRRYLSAQKVGMTEIPCEIVEEPDEMQKAEILIMSNIVARDLTPIEKGRALAYYEEHVLSKDKGFKGNKRDALAKRFGIAGSQVYKLKALIDLIPELQKLINDEAVAYATVYECANLDTDVQKKIYETIVSRLDENGNISGKEVSSIVKWFVSPKAEGEEFPESFDEIMPVPVEEEESVKEENKEEALKPLEKAEEEAEEKVVEKDTAKQFMTEFKKLKDLLSKLSKTDIKKIKSDEFNEEVSKLQEALNTLMK